MSGRQVYGQYQCFKDGGESVERDRRHTTWKERKKISNLSVNLFVNFLKAYTLAAVQFSQFLRIMCA